MKIGVLTWYKYFNYGTKLQAVALQLYLKRQGHIVELIDFEVDDNKITSNSKTKVKTKIYNKIDYYSLKVICNFAKKSIAKRNESLNEFVLRYCQCSKTVSNDEEYINLCNNYDLLIFGSDQIWNPNWFHPYYYADFKEIVTLKFSYAPSIGVSNIDNRLINSYRHTLSNFFAISIREKEGCELLESVLNRKINNVVDPVFLLSKEDWEKLIVNEQTKYKPYVLAYFLTDNINHWRAVSHFAKKKKLDVRVIPYRGMSYLKKNAFLDVDCDKFLDLIKNAEYVLTDSFHACAFSIIFKKKFVVFERFSSKEKKSQNSRIYNLFNKYGIEGSVVGFGEKRILSRNESCLIGIKEINSLIDSSKEFIRLNIEKAGHNEFEK